MQKNEAGVRLWWNEEERKHHIFLGKVSARNLQNN